jgi:two-component SAPR family response regulator
MLVGKRLLIVEDEFLIALDMQRILETAQASATLFARSVEEAEAQGEKLVSLDLAIIEIGPDNVPAFRLAMQLLSSGIAVVFTSSDSQHRHGFSDLPLAPVVVKPFGETDLLGACLQALEQLAEQS